MRVVAVLPDPPLPFLGAATRWYYVLTRALLADPEAEVLVVCDEPARIAELDGVFGANRERIRCFAPDRRRGPVAKVRTLLRPYAYRYSRALATALAAAVEVDTVVHLEQTWSRWLHAAAGPRTVTHVHYLYHVDAGARPPTGVADRLVHRRLLVAERQLFRRGGTLTAVSERIAASIRRTAPAAAVTVVPLAFDLSRYPFVDPPARTPPTVGLIGSFTWGPSLGAGERLLTRIWPRVRAGLPGACLRIVGRDARALAGHVGDDRTTIESDVPDITPHFRALDTLVYAPPGDASGVKVKVQEAMAYGVPVVTNACGIEGFAEAPAEAVGVAESDDEIARATVALLEHVEARRRQARAARELVTRLFGPDDAVATLRAVWAGVAGSTLRTRPHA